MSGFESQRTEAEMRIAAERAIAGLDAFNKQLRSMNDRLAGRVPRPQLRVIEGGRGSAAKS